MPPSAASGTTPKINSACLNDPIPTVSKISINPMTSAKMIMSRASARRWFSNWPPHSRRTLSLVLGDGRDILFRDQRGHPDGAEVGDGHERLGRIVDHVIWRDRQHRHGAGDRCLDRQQLVAPLNFTGRADDFEPRLRPGVLCDGLGMIARRYFQIVFRGGPGLGQALLPLQALFGHLQHGFGLFVVVKGLGEVRGINDGDDLILGDTVAQRNLEFDEPAAKRRQDARSTRRIRFDDTRQHQFGFDGLALRRRDGETVAQR